ncbi:unnamed protein product [marine sediment metagenome]|uniref:Uncharacterized protein n=1 Tax=marine sediment metagenome TaxID=412755 RepID=X1PCB2_9ZZZZ
MIKKFKEKIKFRIAEYLDKKHPDYCWARLVHWALGYEEMNPWGKGAWYYKKQTCKSPYCGKCFTNGRVKRPEEQ